MKLSKHFTLEELLVTEHKDLRPLQKEEVKPYMTNLYVLCNFILEPIRTYYGKAVTVTSGFRGNTLNKRVGGSLTSQHCFDQNTEILTNNGWRKFDTIQSYDRAYTYNIEKDIIELCDIDNVIKYNYEGNLYYADNKHVNFAVTDEHRMLVRYDSHKYKRRNNKNISEKGQKYFDSLKTNNDNYHIEKCIDIYKKRRFFKVAGKKYNNNNYDVNILRLCMAVISDGYLTFCSKTGKFHGVGFNLKKERDKNELEDILKNLGWHYTKTYSKTHDRTGTVGVYQYFINSSLSQEVYEIIGKEKKIPRWFLTLKTDILKTLVITYSKFDGTIDNRQRCNGITIFSKDEENIDILQLMCVFSNMRCVKKEFKNREVKICGYKKIMPYFYHLYITTNSNESRVNEDCYHKFYYKGIVWCIKNKNTTCIIRRNGKISIQGNCLGEAADFLVAGKTVDEVFEDIRSGKIDICYRQLIKEKINGKFWIHIAMVKIPFNDRDPKYMQKLTTKDGKNFVEVK